MKKNLALILALCVCLAMYGCAGDTGNLDESETRGELFPLFKDVLESNSASDQKEEDVEFPGKMEMVGQHNGFLYFRDEMTDILYIVHGRKGSSPFVMMVNPITGLPMTYSQYLEIGEKNDG